ncbi:WD40-repeat-containing domain protein [Rhodocollybia butyracea]|uniref:Pre-rRNA-processing protein IPI3 n=1 Tax=Rhodocollybia butyracea TaxID=206335 RepID=A0A9P5QAH4_9AGAR|nr:WD40-repeat-containing domain protein [Rhodocollybia butyracea]
MIQESSMLETNLKKLFFGPECRRKNCALTMHLHEIIFCATSSPASGSGSITLHDISTGASLASFKQNNAFPHCTTFLTSKNAQGGFILAAQPDKSLLHAYNFQKDQISLKIVLPEKLTCVSSGTLFNSWDAHYRQINVLRFTRDDAALLSGSDDSGVSVWSISRLLDGDSQNTLPLPYFTLSDHTLPVTDIVCGIGAFPECRVLTASVDHSVKLWDLSSRTLLTTFMFPQPISCLAWETTERLFFAASSSDDGSIYQMNLFRQLEDKSKGNIVEAVGGGGLNDVIRAMDIDESSSNASQKKRLITVGHPVTCISLSLTSSLLVGTSSGLLYIYDSPTHQLLRTISTHKGLSISYLATLLKPIDLTGHVSISLGLNSSASSVTTMDTIPVKPIVPFQRMRDSKTRETHEVSMMLPSAQRHEYEDESTLYTKEALLRDHAFFTGSANSSSFMDDSNTVPVLKSRVSELETEVATLRNQLGQAKGVNNLMWETVVQKVVHGQGKSAGDDSAGDERRRKRGRSDDDLDVHS